MKNIILLGVIGLTFTPVPRCEPERDALSLAFALFICLCIGLGILDGLKKK